MATEIAKAYVQIVPTTKGIGKELEKGLGGSEGRKAGASGGSVIGGAMVGKIVGVVAAAQIGKTIVSGISSVVKKSMSAGGELEQSIGGVETLFKKSSDKVIKNADKAFKTAGLSANDYMQTVTSFSASLLQGLGGDTKKASKISNMAIIDMADNANKMGTSMESIQNAYQGFAKGQFMMLDNLKLGYGGTKTEMARLINDMGLLGDTMVTVGQKGNFDEVVSYDLMIKSIHKLQQELSITGTTSKEAATTLQGSFASMQANWSNLLADMATGRNIKKDIKNLATTVSTYLFGDGSGEGNGNALGMVQRILQTLPTAAKIMFEKAQPVLLPMAKEFFGNIVTDITNYISEKVQSGEAMQFIKGIWIGIQQNAPKLLKAGAGILQSILMGVVTNLPLIGKGMFQMISHFGMFIIANLPQILDVGGDMLTTLIDGLFKALPKLVGSAYTIGTSFIKFVLKNIPAILKAGITLLIKLGAGLIKGLPELAKTVLVVSEKMFSIVKDTDWLELGVNLIKGIIDGIKDALPDLIDSVKDVGKQALDGIKDVLGIHSPSIVMDKEVGRMYDKGFARGISGNTDIVAKAADSLGSDVVGVSSRDIAKKGKISASKSGISEAFDRMADRIAVGSDIYLDGNILVGRTADRMNKALGKRASRLERGVVTVG